MRRAVLLAGALAALAPSSSAAAGWTAPFAISADRSVLGASAGADARGGVVAVWQHDTKRAQPPRDGGVGGTESFIRARAITADGRHGRVQTLSIRDDLTAGPAVAVNRGGDAVAVWTQAHDGRRFAILAASRPRSGRFGRPQALGRTDRFLGASPRVAVNDRGDAVVLWAKAARGVQLVTRRAGGRFGIGQTLAARRPLPAGVVLDADGGAVAAWTASGGVFVTERRAHRRFGAPRRLNASGPGGVGTTLARGAGGTVVVAWRTRDSTVAAVRDPRGSFGPAQTLATYEPSASFSGPAAAVTDSGETLLAWTQGVREGPIVRNEIAIASRGGGATFGRQRVLSAPGVYADRPVLAVDRRGEVVAVWSEAGPIGASARSWTSAAVRPARAGDFGAGERLSGATDISVPVALVAGDATATAVWRHGDNEPLLAARRRAAPVDAERHVASGVAIAK